MKAAGEKPRLAIYGLGAIGRTVARAIMADGLASLVAAIDTDPAKVGKDVASLLRIKGASSVIVSHDAEATLTAASPDVVIHCTGSRFADVAPQIEGIISCGISCVTSCEEMALPEATDPELAARIDRLAKEHSACVVAAGVNPGFVMDLLVVALSGATRRVTHVQVERVLDPMSRRQAFRRKVGVGMKYQDATLAVARGEMGHVGLRQSALLIAKAMGWTPTAINEGIEVLCGDETPGKRNRRPRAADETVSGLMQTLRVRNGSREVIRMEMVMQAGAEAPHDAITITGDPPLSLWMQGGIPGDQATVACLINTARRVAAAPIPGLLTLLDLPLRPAGQIFN